MASEPADFLGEMKWRGLLYQCTDQAGLAKHLAQAPRRAYAGFDPTADSLTIGNLVGIMALRRFQRAGHHPVALMGGGTGLIGDPSGKSAERQLNTKERVAANVERIKNIFDAFIDFSPAPSGTPRATMVNNIDWLAPISYLDALRDIGKHFSVNMMIQKDSVKSRLESRDQGISYTEFSYMILQAYDYAHLYKHEQVTLQMGGSDQWGNIVAGGDLIRRYSTEDHELRARDRVDRMLVEEESRPPAPGEAMRVDIASAFGLTWPLVTKADGTKFGKTESGAIWLTPERTSPYAYYQFWLNAADADVVRFLKTFTDLAQDEVTALEHALAANPGAREAQRALARNATALLHGPSEMQAAEDAAKALFSGDIAGLPERTLAEVFEGVPSSDHAKPTLEGEGVPVLDLLITTGLAASKREAREFLSGGSVTINGRKAGPDDRLRTSDLLHGRVIALRRGKKQWHLTRWG